MCETGQESIQKQRTQQIQATLQERQQTTAAPQLVEQEQRAEAIHAQGEAMGSLVTGQFPPAPPADPPQDPPPPAAEQYQAPKTKEEKKEARKMQQRQRDMKKEAARRFKLEQKQREKEEKEAARRLKLEQKQRERQEKEAYAQKSAEERAAIRTRNGGVVPGAGEASWNQYGGASFHMTYPKEEALRIVQQSKGFLCAVKVEGEDDVMELRATIPETFTIRNADGSTQEIPLRKNYILFTKSLCAFIVDKNGKVRSDLGKKLPKLSDLGDDYRDEVLRELVRDGMGKLYSKKEAEQKYNDVMKTMQAFQDTLADQTMGLSFFHNEIISSYVKIASLAHHTRIGAKSHIKRVKQALTREGASREKIEQYEKAVQSFYADVDQALQEMRAIRNMDPDSEQAPLPNTCSANGSFTNDVRRLCNNDNPGAIVKSFSYSTPGDYFPSHVEECLRHRASHAPAEQKEQYEAELQRLTALHRQIAENGTPLTEDDARFLDACRQDAHNHLQRYKKYDYHIAGNIDLTYQGEQFTTECFAAETKQAVASPFSLHTAVGRYKGAPVDGIELKSPGMVSYYNQDNPLPEGDDVVLCDLSRHFSEQSLPGDPNYHRNEGGTPA